MDKPKVIVICGPTASGKTKLSINLAKKVDGEIVSCDSMQIYKDMNIGSAKPTVEEMQGIKHYLTDCVSPEKRYSVSEYKENASNAIKEIIYKGKVPIIVGGTGLYLNSLIYNIQYNDMDIDIEYRKMLEKEATENGLEALYNRAKEIDSEAMEKISKNDKKRIMRILEIYKATGKNKTGRAAGPGSCGAPYFVLPAWAGREEERKRGRDSRDLHIIHPFCDRLDYAMEN